MFDQMFLCDAVSDVHRIMNAGPTVKRLPEKSRHTSPSNGIAVIQVRGVLTKYGSDVGPAMIDLAWQIDAAAADPAVGTIVLWCDSGGGTVAGTFEVATAVANAVQRKQVIGLADDLTASGAYLILSQCTKVYASNRMTMVGSIGVVQVLLDMSDMAKQVGLKVLRLRSGDLKGIGIPGVEITEDEMSYLRKLVMFAANEFIMAVSKGRSLPADQVRQMATGAVWPAPEAVRLGLIDGIRTINEVLTDAVTTGSKAARDDRAMVALVSEAVQFSKAVAKLVNEGDELNVAIEDAQEAHPKLFKSFEKFKSLPTWQRAAFSDKFPKGVFNGQE